MRYILIRIGYAMLVFAGAGLVASVLLALIPDAYIERSFSERVGLNLASLLTLSDQYIAQGLAEARNFSALDILEHRSINSAKLIGGALLILLMVGIPTGLYRGLRMHSKPVRRLSTMLHVFSAIPVLVWGAMLLFWAREYLDVLPVQSLLDTEPGWVLSSFVYILPMFTLAFGDSTISNITRVVEVETRQAMDRPYMHAVRARGVPVKRHLIRNLITPVVGAIVEKIPYIVSGTIVVEYLFDWPGLGYQLLQEVQQVGDKSYFFLLIATIFLVAVVLLLNLLRDLVTVINDPRLRRQ